MPGVVVPVGSPGWAARRLARKLACGAVPLRAHLEMAGLRGKLSRLSRIPDAVIANLKSVEPRFTDREIVGIARRYMEYSRTTYLARVLRDVPGFHDTEVWEIDGLNYVRESLQKKKGAILVTAHLGYPRLIAPILRLHGIEADQVVSGRADRIDRIRERNERVAKSGSLTRALFRRLEGGLERPYDIVAGLDARPIFSALSQNHAITIPGEGMRATEFAELTLFGRPFPIPTGFMKIAMITGTPVLPVFALNGGGGRSIYLRIDPPLKIEHGQTVEQNLQTWTQALNEQLGRTPHLWTRWTIPDLFARALAWSKGDLSDRYSAHWYESDF